ncbi:MAG: DUF1670 domain-containing protein [Oligoflexia bacterium]|nr:DUF1670 domain-containing protein [Oligoflexia bacterium]
MKPVRKSAHELQYGPLGDLTVEATAYQVVSRRFDFGLDSAICQHLVQRTFAALADEERRRGVQRVPPFTLRLDVKGHSLDVPLVNEPVVRQLVAGTPLAQVQQKLREALFKRLLRRDPSVEMDDVRRMLAPSALLACYGGAPARPARLEQTDDYRMDLRRLRETLSVPEALVPAPQELSDPPAAVVEQIGPVIEQEGRSPESARALISHLQALRQRFCARLDELSPGQLVAVATDLRDRRLALKTRLRAHVPVRLTLYHEAELAALQRLGPRDHKAVDQVLSSRVARLLTEAYCQGGLLSLTLVAMLTQQSPARVGRLVNAFEAAQKLILPTPGTIHDAGSKMTHKALVVRMHLEGKECKQIARQTFHTEEAVDRYVDDFERTLIARAHGLPASLLPRVLKLGAHVVQQYEALIAQHIGDTEQVRIFLRERGIDIDQEAVA